MNYRPDDWEKIVRAECYDGDNVYRELDTFEAGADAMLGALFELAKKSPTKTFTIDSRAINIFSEEEK